MEPMRATIRDVALAADVSVATVNRALTGKPRISEATRRRVEQAAAELGFTVNRAAQALGRNPIHIGLIYHDIIPAFTEQVIKGVRQALDALRDFNVVGEIARVPCHDDPLEASAQFVREMDSMAARGVQGVLLLPNDNVEGYSECIDRLLQRNVRVATVITDLPDSHRRIAVRTNGIIGGRMAAELLWRFGCRKTVIFSSSVEVAICRENVAGYTEFAGSHGVGLLHNYGNRDMPERAYAAVDRLVAEYPEADGIYICTANSASVCRRLLELGLRDRYTIVASDLFEDLRGYLLDGLVAATLWQDPVGQGELAVRKLFEAIENGSDETHEHLLIPRILIASNLDAFDS